MEIMRQWILQFGVFLIDQLALLLLTVTLANIFIGAMVAIKEHEFKIGEFFEGVISAIFLLISYVLIGIFIFMLKAIASPDMQIFVTAYTVLTLLIIAYKANSMLLSFVYISKIPMPKIMQQLDEKVKAMFDTETYLEAPDYTKEQAYLLDQEMLSPEVIQDDRED